MSDWSHRQTAAIGQEIKRLRRAHQPRWSAQQLSQECTRWGHPIPRPVIFNLENGSRESVSVAEILVLSWALGVAPTRLMTGVASFETEIEVLPEVTVPAAQAFLWIAGHTSRL